MIKQLIEKAIKGDQAAIDQLFREYESHIRECFYPKISKIPLQKWKKLPVPKGLAELCRETLEKTIDDIKKQHIDLNDENYKFENHCQEIVEKVWDEYARKANEGDTMAFNTLYLLCWKQMQAKFLKQIGPAHKDLVDDLCHDLFVLAHKKIQKEPYKIEYPFYTYLNEIVGAKYLVVRLKQGKATISIETSPEETRQNIYNGLPNNDSPEGGVLIAAEIKSHLLKIQQSLLLKLGMLKFCAEFSKPHQFIAFGFNKWLKQKTEDVAQKCEGKVIKRLSEELVRLTNTELKEFENLIHEKALPEYSPEFRKSLKEISNSINDSINTEQVADCFLPFMVKISELVKEIYKEKEYKDLRLIYGNSIIKERYLTDFRISKKQKEKSLAENISDWTDKVRKSTWNALRVR